MGTGRPRSSSAMVRKEAEESLRTTLHLGRWRRSWGMARAAAAEPLAAMSRKNDESPTPTIVVGRLWGWSSLLGWARLLGQARLILFTEVRKF
jgi:hypothetical protein